MSLVKIEGNASGTGVFTVASPNSNTDRTLTLPDNTGTLLNNNSDITSQVKTATNASGDAPVYACRAWVNFNGTGTVAIRASGNVSSITDNGTGDYTVNFTTAMPDANYCIATSGPPTTGEVLSFGLDYTTPTKTTSAVRLNVKSPNIAKTDSSECNVAIFR